MVRLRSAIPKHSQTSSNPSGFRSIALTSFVADRLLFCLLGLAASFPLQPFAFSLVCQLSARFVRASHPSELGVIRSAYTSAPSGRTADAGWLTRCTLTGTPLPHEGAA